MSLYHQGVEGPPVPKLIFNDLMQPQWGIAQELNIVLGSRITEFPIEKFSLSNSLIYWKCNFPMKTCVSLLIGWLVDRSVIISKKSRELILHTLMLLSENLIINTECK